MYSVKIKTEDVIELTKPIFRKIIVLGAPGSCDKYLQYSSLNIISNQTQILECYI